MIAVGITHASFSEERRTSILRLKSELKAQGIVPLVEEDPVGEGNLLPWIRTMKRLIETGLPFLAMLPDDAFISADFGEKLELFAKKFPDEVMCLYPNHPIAKTLDSEGYLTPDGFAGFALMPRRQAQDFLSWRATELLHPDLDSRHGGSNSDEQVALWLMVRGASCLKPLPGIVDHDDRLSSLEGHDTDSFRRAVPTKSISRSGVAGPYRTYQEVAAKLLTHLRIPKPKEYYAVMRTPCA